MLRYMIDRARPGLVAFYDIRPGNGVGLFLQPRNPHRATKPTRYITSYHLQVLVIDDCWGWSSLRQRNAGDKTEYGTQSIVRYGQ